MAIILTLIFFLTSIFAPGGGYSAIRTDDMLSINAKRILHEFKVESHRTDRSGRGVIILSDQLGDGKIYRVEANNLDGIRKATIQVGTPEKGIQHPGMVYSRKDIAIVKEIQKKQEESGWKPTPLGPKEEMWEPIEIPFVFRIPLGPPETMWDTIPELKLD